MHEKRPVIIKLSGYFFRKFLDKYTCNSLSEDFETKYFSELKEKGILRTNILSSFRLINTAVMFFLESIIWSFALFKNNCKIVIRNIKRQKVFSLINIIGLSLGMLAAIFISLYIFDELNYDRFHSNSDQIFRLENKNNITYPGPLAPLLKEEIPEISDFVRIYAPMMWGNKAVVSYNNQGFYEDGFILADPSFFKIFTFPFLKGDPETALDNISSIVITEKTAKKYFNNENPIGSVLTYNDQYDYIITGVIKDIPQNSHLKFDFVIPFENYNVTRSYGDIKAWNNNAFPSYFLLNNNTDILEITNKINGVLKKHGKSLYSGGEPYLRPLTDIYLYSSSEYELSLNSEKLKYVYIFSALAALILLIACMNFINLSTARASHRVKEVGMRKVVGASRNNIIRQFLGESVLLTLFSLVLSSIFVYLLLPYFNMISGKNLNFGNFFNLKNGIILLSIVMMTGIAGGSFPAFYISSFRPIAILRGMTLSSRGKKSAYRSILVTLQFIITISLITGTVVIYNQMDYIRNKNLGFDKDRLIAIRTYQGKKAIEEVPFLKKLFLENENIINVTLTSHTPGNSLWWRILKVEGDKEKERRRIAILWTDHDFVSTYKIDIAAGRYFSDEYTSDSDKYFVINEEAVKMIGWKSNEEAIGKRVLIYRGTHKEIIGVLKDFHFMSLHTKITPIIFQIEPRRFFNITVRIKTDNVSSTIDFLRNKWKDVLPDRPFVYQFVDEDYDNQYRADMKLGSVMAHFAFLSVVIACLGLFGLVTFISEQRTKEIGIRKVIGATVSNIIMLISKYFINLILISNVIAIPLSYYIMNKWLQNFEYKAGLNIITFLVPSLFTLGIAIFTVSWQSAKAACANPVDSLRNE